VNQELRLDQEAGRAVSAKVQLFSRRHLWRLRRPDPAANPISVEGRHFRTTKATNKILPATWRNCSSSDLEGSARAWMMPSTFWWTLTWADKTPALLHR
jgi:hypothetical protein